MIRSFRAGNAKNQHRDRQSLNYYIQNEHKICDILIGLNSKTEKNAILFYKFEQKNFIYRDIVV